MGVKIEFDRRAIGVVSVGFFQVLCTIMSTNPHFVLGPRLPLDRLTLLFYGHPKLICRIIIIFASYFLLNETLLLLPSQIVSKI